MNDRLLDMQNRYQIQALQLQDAQKGLYQKLLNYEKLKPAYYGLIDLSMDQIFEAISSLESNPQKVWDLVEKHYKPNFFEGVIIKRYANIFENKEESDFAAQMSELRVRVALEISNVTK